MKLMRLFLALCMLCALAFGQGGEATYIRNGTTLPNPSKQWSVFVLTSGTQGLYVCTANPCTTAIQWIYAGLPATSGVTAGSYTYSTITVDVTGRVTAASNGATNGLDALSLTGGPGYIGINSSNTPVVIQANAGPSTVNTCPTTFPSGSWYLVQAPSSCTSTLSALPMGVGWVLIIANGSTAGITVSVAPPSGVTLYSGNNTYCASGCTATSLTLNPNQQTAFTANSTSYYANVPAYTSVSTSFSQLYDLGLGIGVFGAAANHEFVLRPGIFPCDLYATQLTTPTMGQVLQNCDAWVETNLGGTADAKSLGAGYLGDNTIQANVQLNRLLAPTLTKVASGTGTAYGSSVVVYGAYQLTSSQGDSSASAEASITVDSTCPGSGNCFVQMSSPTYAGSAGTYKFSADTTGVGYHELLCGSVAVGSTQAFGQCAGATIPKTDYAAEWDFPPNGIWTCHLTATDCITGYDELVVTDNLPGSANGLNIVSDSTTNLTDALFGTDQSPKNGTGAVGSGQAYIGLAGFQVSNTNLSATVPNALRFSNTSDHSYVAHIQAINITGNACNFYATGYSGWDFLHCDAFGTNASSTGTALQLGKSGAAYQSSITSHELTLVHPGTGGKLLSFFGGQVMFVADKIDEELDSPVIAGNVINDLCTGGGNLGIFDINTLNVGHNLAGGTQKIIQIESACNQFEIHHLNSGGQTGVIPINDLRAAARVAQPYTGTQCSNNTNANSCPYEIGNIPEDFENGVVANGLTAYGTVTLPGGTVLTDSGSQWGSPTGGAKGAGTINLAGGLYINGAAVLPVGQTPFSIGATVNSTFSASQVIVRQPIALPAGQSVTVASGCNNSQAVLDIAATATTTFSMTKNGTQFGTFTFAASGTTATFTCSSATTFNPGDVIRVIAPATADATAANLGLSIYGVR
jgi:hypothetical protein